MSRKPSGPLAAAEAALRAHALGKPEATEHFPWGERAIKVKGKVFLFMSCEPTRLSLSTKLPSSSAMALLLPFASPTGYGLGKAGWVSAAFASGDPIPVDMLLSWIDESYLAVAPAKLASLARGAAAAAPGSEPAEKPRAPRTLKAAARPSSSTKAAAKPKSSTKTRVPSSKRRA